MVRNFLQKSIDLLLKRQTNILSAAFVIMATVIFSQVLGLVRQRLLVSIFGASDMLGVYLAAARLPDFLFQIIIAGALSSAFIPVFSDYLQKGKEKDGYQFASTMLLLGLTTFLVLSVILFFFAQPLSHVIAPGFSNTQIALMANLIRIILVGEMLFIIGSFLSAVLQSYNHFFIPGIAAALYNLGMIIGILVFAPLVGIYAPACGVILGSLIFVLMQLPLAKRVGFTFLPTNMFRNKGVKEVLHLMVPRTISLGVFQLGTLITVTLISYLSSPGRSYVIFDYAQTLAFAPVALFGQTIAQAAFPVLSRQKDHLNDFKATFLSSFFQMLYLVLPISVLFFVLRIPIVRLIYGASQFDWEATRLTGKVLALFSLSLFAQALTYLVSRGFYALHDTKTPLIIGTVTTVTMVVLGGASVFLFRVGIEGIALSYSLASMLNFFILFVMLDRKVGGFKKLLVLWSTLKIFVASLCTGFALYVPIKLLDRLVFDTTHTINLLLLTGISSLVGLLLYLFLTWLFNVQEAATFILLFKKVGNWREILKKSDEVIDGARLSS